MSRKIALSRIHAINWFGYNDTLEVHGNLLIAGVTGSGKSVLMDVIQLVLVGDQRAKYNQSATGTASTRNLKSYCLGDTKQDIDGAPQYMREKGSITYVALEFRWPDRKRTETWGLRIEFDSAAQNQPNRKDGFFVPCSLEKADWLHEDRTPLDAAAFSRFVNDNRGTVFKTMDSYRREMGIPSHLNFDRGVIDYLLPAAMSFTFLRSFNDFCRQYILPGGEVDIRPVAESFQMFRNFERELAVLRDQLTRLEQINQVNKAMVEAERDRAVYRHVEAELKLEWAREAVGVLQTREAALEDALADDNRRLLELEEQLNADGLALDALKAALTATEEGQLFMHLRNRNKELVPQIARLEEIGKTVEESVRARIRQTEKWLASAKALPFAVDSTAIRAVELAVSSLAEKEGEGIRDGVRQLAERAQGTMKTVELAAKELFADESKIERERVRLNQLLAALRLGMVPEASVLLDRLNGELPKHGAGNPARALRELCELKDEDEEWRAAVEVAFARKFAVVVDERDFDAAERIYHSLKHDAPRESLVNPAQALAQPREARPGSLAEKLETSHPVARAVVNQTLGDLVCVEKTADLRNHPRAILRDGFMYQRPFVERRAHYQNNPVVGKRGLEKQREFLQHQLDDVQLSQKILVPKANAVRDFLAFARDCRLDSDSIHDNLGALGQLAEKEAELEGNIEQMRRIRDLGIDEKEEEIARLETCRAGYSRERDALLTNQKQAELLTVRHEMKLRLSRASGAEDAFRSVQLEGPDISLHLARYQEVRALLLREWPAKDSASDRARDRFHEADKNAGSLRQELIAFRRELAMAHPAFMELEPEASSNAAYDSRLEKIRAGDVPTYEEKAKREKTNWQHLFRTQVLAKLHAALFDVENLMAVLNQELRAPIGNNQYQITRRPNPDREYRVYRDLVDSSAAVREDDLFFNSMDADVRQLIEDIFHKLIDQPESKEALAFLDHRNYHDYDMLVTDTRSADARPSSVDRHSGKFSGGENQSPYFVAILACYLRAYHRYERRRRDPSLALVPIDEAFSKLSGERIRDCIGAVTTLDLQGVFSMSSGNIPSAMDMCDQIVTVMKREKTVGRKLTIRNLPVSLTREEAIERYGPRT